MAQKETNERTLNDARVVHYSPDHAVKYAAQLAFSPPRQDRGGEFESMPLEAVVTFGEQEFREQDGFGFSLRFRRAVLALYLLRCNIFPGSEYERTLSNDESMQVFRRTNDIDFAGGAGASVNVGVNSQIPLLGIFAKGGAKADYTADMKRRELEVERFSKKYKIVGKIPNNRWEIGTQKHGDPTTESGCLHNMYFLPPGDTPLDSETGYSPLCIVGPNGKDNYAITAELRVRKADCVYIPHTAKNEKCSDINSNKLVMEKLVATKMLEEQNRRDGFDPPEGELIIARGRIYVERQK